MQLLTQIFFNGSTRGLASAIIAYFFNSYLPRVYQIMIAPFTDPEMLWILTPLIISTALMQLYFGRYRQEELGWNTAFGNSIMLMFVSVNLFQHLYGILGGNLVNDSRFYLISAVLMFGFIQLVLNFFHKMPEKYAFLFSSSAFVNILAYIMIILTYKQFKPDATTLIASATIFGIVYIAMTIVKYISPMSASAKDYVAFENEKKKIRKKDITEAAEKREKTKEASLKYLKYALFPSLAISILVPYFLEFSGLYEINLGLIWLIRVISSSAILALSLYIIRKENVSFLQFNYNKKLKDVLAGIAVGILVFCGFSVLDYIIAIYFPSLATSELSLGRYGLIFAVAGIAVSSLADEILFRGILQRFLKGKTSGRKAVFIQALIYPLAYFSISNVVKGSYHLIIIDFFALFIIGLVNGFLREKAGLEASIASAFAYRGLVVFTMVI